MKEELQAVRVQVFEHYKSSVLDQLLWLGRVEE
jgi:hypothetical protein